MKNPVLFGTLLIFVGVVLMFVFQIQRNNWKLKRQEEDRFVNGIVKEG